VPKIGIEHTPLKVRRVKSSNKGVPEKPDKKVKKHIIHSWTAFLQKVKSVNLAARR
jgi:hypothetical protein